MIKQHGFSLLEVIFVLAVWSIIILISAPLTYSIIDSQQERQFFTTLQADIFYIQNLAIGSDEYVRIVFDETNYRIRRNTGKPIAIRHYPKDWKINKRTLDTISFNENGTIRFPGTMSFKTKQETYRVVFPLGKGRGYIEKQ